ncbi:MAG: SusC/RagA family TonB-linked outer membrane protein [Bacteroidales bacterium]
MRKNLKRIFLSIFLLITTVSLAQNRAITGTVTEKGNVPIPGATVVVKGSTLGTTTNADGYYSIEVPMNATNLVFSFVGYETQDILIGNQAVINVELVSTSTELTEVIVVGYGTQKVANVSGAISTVKARDIEIQKPVRIEEAFQGRSSGVSVIQGGSPGSKPTILIRGIPSYTGTDPLVIIDGVPQSVDDLNAIDASEIESINVLKDASSTAIYGVKAGNGVIVVTTFKGRKNQKAEFSYNSYFGTQQVMKTIGVLNATEYGAMINEGSVAAGGDIIFPDLSVLGVGTNWQDQIFKSASISSNSLTVKGGGENVGYFLSASYLSQGGIVGGSDKSNFNRGNVTANLDFDLTKKLKFILNTNYVNIRGKSVLENSFNSIIGSALNFDPTVPVYNTDPNSVGKYGYSNLILSEIFNPLTKLQNTYNNSNGNKLYGKGELQYRILDNLKLNARFGYVKWDEVGKSFIPLVFYGPLNVENTMNADGSTVTGKHNSVTEYSNSNFSFTYETFANYNITIREKHNFDAVIGFSLSKSTSSGFTTTRQDVPFNSWTFADISSATGENSATNTNAYTGSSWQGITRKNLSYFGRINYDFSEKYLVSFSARRDGSIAFGTQNKFAYFYAGSLGWIVTNEDFMKIDFINYLKVRGSYGTTGNENVDPQFVQIVTGGPSYTSTANSNGYTFVTSAGDEFVPGSTVNSFKNETLRWEKQKQLNVGFDITVLKNMISLSFDYFKKNVDGLLFVDTPPLYAGTSVPVASNIGTTESKGIDLTLGFTENTKTVKFNTSLTFTTSKNLVTATNRDGTAMVTGGSYYNGQSQNVTRFQKGYTPGYFYGYKTDGLFQSVAEIEQSATQTGAVPGDIKFVDVHKDGVINDLDRTKIGDPFPKFTMGWNINLEYKNFDLGIFTYASVGNDIYRAYERNAQYTNKFRSILNRWTGPGSTNDARYPRYSFNDANSNIRASDRYVEDGSFIKIKNIVLGYTLPSSWYSKIGITKLRIYAQVKNLYTFTKYSGYDPEIAGGILDTGVDRGNYPQARTISMGLNLNF